MGEAKFTLTGLPEPGEQYMTTGDLRDFMARLRRLHDDGTAEVTVKLGRRNRMKQITATVTAPDPQTDSWDAMLDEARYDMPALEPPMVEYPDESVTLIPAAGEDIGTTLRDGRSGAPAFRPDLTGADTGTVPGEPGDTLTGIPAIQPPPPEPPRARLSRGGRGTHARQ